MHQQTYFHHSRNMQIINDGYDVQGAFLDSSKAFDKLWHQGLYYKL